MIFFSLTEFIFVAFFFIAPPLLNVPKSEILVLDFSKGYSISTYAVFLFSVFIIAERIYADKKNKKTSDFNEKKIQFN